MGLNGNSSFGHSSANAVGTVVHEAGDTLQPWRPFRVVW